MTGSGTKARVLVLHGPNLNLLGLREPEVYGKETLADVNAQLEKLAAERALEITCRQSNHEGQLIDWLHEARLQFDGVLINPGGYTHTSVALHDAVQAMPFPVIEVHLSNVHAREGFRRRSLIAPVARGQISGLGWYGYLAALDALVALAGGERP